MFLRSRWQVTSQPHPHLSVCLSVCLLQSGSNVQTCFHTTGGSQNSSLPQPLFKRVVVMLVDALREDFVFGASGRLLMPYTRRLLERGSAHSFVAKARAPTVTMPRIKVSCEGSESELNRVCPLILIHFILN